MKKPFILFLSLFSFSSLFIGAQAQISPPNETTVYSEVEIETIDPIALPPIECWIGYYNVPQPPVCETIIGEDGQEEQQCTAVGSAAYAGVINRDEPSFSEENFPLNDIDWSGYCNCNLLVYNSADFTGYWLTYPFSEATEDRIVVGDILKVGVNSFRITCTF